MSRDTVMAQPSLSFTYYVNGPFHTIDYLRRNQFKSSFDTVLTL